MEIISDKQKYFELIKDFEYIPVTQSEGWYDFHAYKNPERIIFIVDALDNPAIACFAHVKKFLHLKMLQIEGEATIRKTMTSKQIQLFYREITNLGYDFIETNSQAIYNPEYEIGIRKAGYLRPVGLFSTHLSVLVDLNKALTLSSNWEKNLKIASRQKFSFEVVELIQEKHIQEFLSQYKTLLNDKKFDFQLNKDQISQLLTDQSFGLANIKDEEDSIIACFVFYKHEKYAESIFRTKKDSARKTGATFFLYVKLLDFLRKNGVEYFDMGRITPGNKSKDGVADFKTGIKGALIIYNGEWSWYKKPLYRPLMYFVKKYLFNRNEL